MRPSAKTILAFAALSLCAQPVFAWPFHKRHSHTTIDACGNVVTHGKGLVVTTYQFPGDTAIHLHATTYPAVQPVSLPAAAAVQPATCNGFTPGTIVGGVMQTCGPQFASN